MVPVEWLGPSPASYLKDEARRHNLHHDFETKVLESVDRMSADDSRTYFRVQAAPGQVYEAFPYVAIGHTEGIAGVERLLERLPEEMKPQEPLCISQLPGDETSFLVGPFNNPAQAYQAVNQLQKADAILFAEPEYDRIDPEFELRAHISRSVQLQSEFQKYIIDHDFPITGSDERPSLQKKNAVPDEEFYWNLESICLPKDDHGAYRRYLTNTQLRIAVIDEAFSESFFNDKMVCRDGSGKLDPDGLISPALTPHTDSQHGSRCATIVNRVASGSSFMLFELPNQKKTTSRATHLAFAIGYAASNKRPKTVRDRPSGFRYRIAKAELKLQGADLIVCSLKAHFSDQESVTTSLINTINKVTSGSPAEYAVPIIWAGPMLGICNDNNIQAYPKILSVGSSGPGDNLSCNSCLGAGIDLLAPGHQVYFSRNNEDHHTGTSYAAPHVAGLLAILMHEDRLHFPDLPRLTPRELHALLRCTWKKAGVLDQSTVADHKLGIINVENAINRLMERKMEGVWTAVEKIVQEMRKEEEAWNGTHGFA